MSKHQPAESLAAYSPERWQESHENGALLFVARGSGGIHDEKGNGLGEGEWRVLSMPWLDDIAQGSSLASTGGIALGAEGLEHLAAAARRAAAVLRAGRWVTEEEHKL
jgi:hypothetical protein